MTEPHRALPAAALSAALALVAPTARAELFRVDKLTAYGDFRFRTEFDRDSQDAAGVPRDDRTRLRARIRAGAQFDPNEHWRFEARLRTGDEGNQQGPHVTLVDFHDDDTGEASFDFDRWYLRGTTGKFWAWAGRNNLPFWTQDELLFDDDVTYAGVGAGWDCECGNGMLAFSTGWFSPPVGMREFTGQMYGAQVAWHPELAGIDWSFAGGGYVFEANPDDPDAALLLEGNGSRDYRLFQLAAQARFVAGGRPLVVGADVMHNAEPYSPTDADPVTAANADETDGVVVLATWGGLAKKNDWLVGWFWTRLETLANFNSYATDDWVRWGNATQVRTSNLEAHELRFGWAFDPRMNVLARLFLAEAITTVEAGKRLRVDFNYRF